MNNEEELELFQDFKRWKEKVIDKYNDELFDQGETLIRRMNDSNFFSFDEPLEDHSFRKIEMLEVAFLMGDMIQRKYYVKETRKVELKKCLSYYRNYLHLCYLFNLHEKLPNDMPKYIEKIIEDPTYQLILKRDEVVENYHVKSNLLHKVKLFQNGTNYFKYSITEEDQEAHIRDNLFNLLLLHIFECCERFINISREFKVMDDFSRNIDPSTLPPNSIPTPNPNVNTLASSSKTAETIRILKIEKKNQVFGKGYPSLPKLTIEQWADQEIALGNLSAELGQPPKNDKNDFPKESEQQKLERERVLDEFKDWNRRGRGNTKDQG